MKHSPEIGVVVTLLVLTVLAPVAGCGSRSGPREIVVGHVAPFSGANRLRGEHARQGILLAVEDADRRADAARIVVQHADSARDEDAGPAAVRLATLDKAVALLGGADPAQLDALAGVAKSYALPLIAGEGLPPRPANLFVFRVGLEPSFRAHCLARYAAESLKAERANVLVSTSDKRGPAAIALSQALGRGFADDFRGAGRSCEERAFKSPAELRDAALKPGAREVIVLAGSVEDLHELYSSGVVGPTPVLFAADETPPSTLPRAPAGSPLYLATAFVVDASAAREFARRYQERFHELPDALSALAYESTQLLVDGIRRTKDRDRLQPALTERKSYDGLTGPVTWDESLGTRRVGFVVRVGDGTAETVARYEPAGPGRPRGTTPVYLASPPGEVYAFGCIVPGGKSPARYLPPVIRPLAWVADGHPPDTTANQVPSWRRLLLRRRPFA
jgi:branched-chain amino acid transport system substrate-binding protein